MYLLRIFQQTNKFCVPSVSWKTIRKSEILQTLNIKKQWRKKFMLQCRIQLVGGLYNKECFNSLRPHKLSKPHFLVLLSHKVKQKLKLWIIAANPFQIWGRYANLWITVIFIRSWYTKQSMDLFRLIFSGTILSYLILYYQGSNQKISAKLCIVS